MFTQDFWQTKTPVIAMDKLTGVIPWPPIEDNFGVKYQPIFNKDFIAREYHVRLTNYFTLKLLENFPNIEYNLVTIFWQDSNGNWTRKGLNLDQLKISYQISTGLYPRYLDQFTQYKGEPIKNKRVIFELWPTPEWIGTWFWAGIQSLGTLGHFLTSVKLLRSSLAALASTNSIVESCSLRTQFDVADVCIVDADAGEFKFLDNGYLYFNDDSDNSN